MNEIDFAEELLKLVRPDRDLPPPVAAEAFWRAALFTRWALEQEHLAEAADCAAIAGSIGQEEWPGETPEQLAARLLRQGADYMLRCAGEPTADADVARGLCERLAALPFEDARERAAAELRRLRWCNELKAAWRGMEPADVQGLSVRKQVDYWTWRLIDPEVARNAGIGDIIESADLADPASTDPVARLSALGWPAVPFLAARLAEGSATSLQAPVVIRVGDVFSIVLWRLLGDVARPAFVADPIAPWDAGAVERQKAILEKFSLLGTLDERPRWLALLADHSPRAIGWFIVNDPAEVLEGLYKALPSEGRPRALAMRRLEARLAAAPREKLQALRESGSGECRELLDRVLGEAR